MAQVPCCQSDGVGRLTAMEGVTPQAARECEKEKAAEFVPDGSKWSLAGGAKPDVSTKPEQHSAISGHDM